MRNVQLAMYVSPKLLVSSSEYRGIQREAERLEEEKAAAEACGGESSISRSHLSA